MVKRTIVITTGLLTITALLVPVLVFAQQAHGLTSSRSLISNAAEKAQEKVIAASERAAAIKNSAEAKSLQIRQEVCEQKRTRLQSLTQTMYQGAESVKKNLDTMYDRVVSFYDSGKLTVSNYNELIQNIETAKADAEQAANVLQLRENSEIDCADAKTASRIEGDRLAGEATRTALKEYRTQLVNLVSALKSAAATEDTTNE